MSLKRHAESFADFGARLFAVGKTLLSKNGNLRLTADTTHAGPKLTQAERLRK